MINILKFLIFWLKCLLEEILLLPTALIIYILGYRKKEVYNIVICEHIGDIVFTLGYLKAFKEKRAKKQIRIITTKKWIDLIELYPEAYDSTVVVKHWKLNMLLKIDQFQIGQMICRKLNDIKIIDPGNNFTLGYEFARRFPHANLKECIKYGILELEEKDGFTEPVLEKYSIEADKHKTVLLCPYATVTQEIDKRIFEKIAIYYKKQGYRVLTNTVGNQKKIEGTEGIDCNLQELYRLGGFFNCIIGLRSGVLDLLAFCSCPIMVIYPVANNLLSYFDLQKTNPNHKEIKQYILTSNLDADIENIIKILKEFNKIDKE